MGSPKRSAAKTLNMAQLRVKSAVLRNVQPRVPQQPGRIQAWIWA